ncbi:MAG: D-alanine--D-alanine ligase [Pseudomonadota bacterium]
MAENTNLKEFTLSDDEINKIGKVAVLLGGQSQEREVSLRSGKAICRAIKELNVEYEAIDYKPSQLNELTEKAFDKVFIALHGPGGEDGTLQGALDVMGLPYTGSGVLGSALAMDKIRSKQVWEACGLPVPRGYRVTERDLKNPRLVDEIIQAMGGLTRFFVKPSQEGSSLGIAQVETTDVLIDAVKYALNFDTEVLVEEWIAGDELTVTIVGEALPSIRIETPRDFYDYQAKYHDTTTKYFCPSGLDVQEELNLRELALLAFNAIGCTGWGRVDFLKDLDGRMYLLEANTVPGMTESSLVPKAAAVHGWGFPELIYRILKTMDD